jgi:hypothetical protein
MQRWPLTALSSRYGAPLMYDEAFCPFGPNWARGKMARQPYQLESDGNAHGFFVPDLLRQGALRPSALRLCPAGFVSGIEAPYNQSSEKARP